MPISVFQTISKVRNEKEDAGNEGGTISYEV